jgi:hypothetical protein
VLQGLLHALDDHLTTLFHLLLHSLLHKC